MNSVVFARPLAGVLRLLSSDGEALAVAFLTGSIAASSLAVRARSNEWFIHVLASGSCRFSGQRGDQ